MKHDARGAQIEHGNTAMKLGHPLRRGSDVRAMAGGLDAYFVRPSR